MTRNAKGSRTRHPASSVQIEERLVARYIDYRFEANYSIDAIVDVEGQQVRLIEHRAPIEMVIRYAQQMKAGAVFPAIVVNERGELIDGNTRRRAALKAKRSTIPACICRDLTRVQARALSVELNQANGLALDVRELHAFVRSAVLEGETLDTKTCARITGIPRSRLERWKAQAQFEQRAKRIGIHDADVGLLPESVQAALNSIRLVPVLKEAVALAAAARMPASAVRSMVTRANAAASEAAALTIIAEERAARAADIRTIASGFVARRRVGHRSKMHIAALLKLSIDDLLEVPPESREATIARLRDLREHAERAISAASARWHLDGDVSTKEADAGFYAQAGTRG